MAIDIIWWGFSQNIHGLFIAGLKRVGVFCDIFQVTGDSLINKDYLNQHLIYLNYHWISDMDVQ